MREKRCTRRTFLAASALGMVATAVPGLVWAEAGAFDLALEGQDLLTKGEYVKAVEVLTRAAQADAESDWIWGLLGRAQFQLGDMRQSLSSFRRVLQIVPDDTYSRMMVDIISQKPLPPEKKEEKPLSPLEVKAQDEEAQVFATMEAKDGLGYRIQRIVLDAGHGGFDSGAVGLAKLQEKNVTLDLVKRTAAILEKGSNPPKIFLTRTDDYYVPLSARTTVANQYNADLFVSFHINANENRQPSGMDTFFCAEKASSEEAAKVAAFENSVLKYDKEDLVQKGYVNIEEILFMFERRRYWEAGGSVAGTMMKAMAEGIPMRKRGVHSANFYVLRRARMPSILLETGFISNPEEEAKLATPDFRQTVAQGIAQGLSELIRKGV
ncbi:MAG: tetratricopeptide repeat protein [Deltaproteobacteria bacterium]|nr:tetratricopeptide repeat protein [Deltaproteobacteria bacterium]